MSDCIFCKIVEGKVPAQKVYENDRLTAILDINPVAPGHTLVIPRVHHELLTDLPADLAEELLSCAQELARALLRAADAEGFNLLSNNHRCAGQAIPHAHLHVIPRKGGDGIKFQWPTSKYSNDEMETWREKIRRALEEKR